MKVRTSYLIEMSSEALRAFARYHGLDPKKIRSLLAQLRSSLRHVGESGVDDQIHEGQQWLDADELEKMDKAEARDETLIDVLDRDVRREEH